MSIYEFLFEAPPAKKSKNKAKKNKTKVTAPPAPPPSPKPATYNDVLKLQDLNDFKFNKRYQEKGEEYKKNKDEISDLSKYIGELSITGKRLTHTQKYTFRKLYNTFLYQGYSDNVCYALCLLFFEESKFDKQYGKSASFNPTTKAMGIIQWIRSRFAEFVLFLRKKTQNFKNLQPETLENLNYFLNITTDNAKNDSSNEFSVSIDQGKNLVTDEQIKIFNEVLWSQKEMVDYQIEFLMNEFKSDYYKKLFDGLDEEAKKVENQSENFYIEKIVGPVDPKKDIILPPKIKDNNTPDNLINSLTEVEKNFLNKVLSRFIVPNKKDSQDWDDITNERIKKSFEILYDNITRKLDTYDLPDQHLKSGEYKYIQDKKEITSPKHEFNDKKKQLEEIVAKLENKIKENLNDYPFVSEVYEIKEGDLLSKIVKNKGITWKSLVRYNLPFFINYFKDRKDKKKDIYAFASKFYGTLKTKILIPKYNCVIINSKEELQKAAEADKKTVKQLIAFNESELKEIENVKKEKIKEPIHKIDPECKHTQIIFLENSNNKLSEQLIRNYIQNILLEEKRNVNKPYGLGNVEDMLLDNEGWITDPKDRLIIKNWYLKMDLANNNN